MMIQQVRGVSKYIYEQLRAKVLVESHLELRYKHTAEKLMNLH